VVEVKGNQENAHEDPFIQEEKEKKKRVKKQKLNEMRNMASVSKAEEKKKGLVGAIQHVNKSTASLGKFNERLPGEKETHMRGKRKFDDLTSNGNLQNEKERELNVLNKILGKETVLNTERAASLALQSEAKKQKKQKTSNQKGKGKGQQSKSKGKPKGKGREKGKN